MVNITNSMLGSFLEALFDSILPLFIVRIKRKNREGIPTFTLVAPMSEILDTHVLSKLILYMKRRDILSLMCTAKYYNRVIPSLAPHFTVYSSYLIYRINLKGGFDGEHKRYYDKDCLNISRSRQYKDDVLHGREVNFYDNGRVSSIHQYKNGILDGKSVYFDRQTNVLKVLLFERNKAILLYRKPKI